MVQPQRSHRQDGDARLFDQEGVFIRAVGGTAVLDNPKPPCGDLLPNPEVKEDDAIGHVFFQAVARQKVLTSFPRDDCCDTLFLQPAEEPPQFGAEDVLVGKGSEEGLHSVQDHPFGANRINGVAQTDEEPLQVVFAGVLDLAPLDVDIVDGELLFGLELRKVEAEGGDVFG